jgi:transcriptional regulator with XRE-family HTH domain
MRLAGATQTQVSAGTGLTQSHISKVASAGTRVTLGTASRISAFFHCDVSDLFPRETAVGETTHV